MHSSATRTIYDEVPYPSYPMTQTHPDHLATVATLLGLSPPLADRCRVLELGCASGGNLIPLAMALPESTFVGIDLSNEQIADGQSVVDALGLRNIELRRLSILDVDESFGVFDYIICHGVYSWVPPEVQQKILEVCGRQLTPNGVGYVSYNTHPGWHLRGMVRAMMRYHVGRFPADSPESQIRRARDLLEFLVRAAPGQDRSYTLLLREQLELLQKHSDAYLFHEHLEEHNEPVWFLDFCERLSTHRLRYLAEAEFDTMIAATLFAPEVEKELDELAPRLLEKEQYMDFVRNRSFRQTLICHDIQRPVYDIRADRLKDFYVASPLQPKSSSPDLVSDAEEEFCGLDEVSLATSTPLVKAAYDTLGKAWPSAIAFAELLRQARTKLDDLGGTTAKSDESDILVLGRALLTSFAKGRHSLVRLSLGQPPLAPNVSVYPTASPLARLQAQQNQPLTNLRHEVIQVTPFDRHLLPLLDGKRDNQALIAGLMDLYRCGELKISRKESAVTEAAQAKEILTEVLEQQLPILARAALLTA